MPATTDYLHPEVIAALAAEIAAADGSEIFAVLRRSDEKGPYTELQVMCRGTHAEVPALMSRTQPGDMTVHNHPSGVLQPSQADLNVATMFGEEGVGSMIVNNDVTQCRVVVEPSRENLPVPVEVAAVTRIFEKDGALSQALPQFEIRDSQQRMAAAVARNLNENRILAVEAGTGTGKSLAYLVPAFAWAKENRGRVVIATKTIALQEQLVFKDIPIARKVVPDAPQAALVKGRANYVCLRKLNDVRTNQLSLLEEDEKDVEREIEDLAAWVEESGSGDLADLPFMPSREAWDLVRSDADMCLGSKCPFFQRAPFYESRRQAAKAKILVVNQALLFSDLSVRTTSGNYKASAVIPPYEHVVLDEAHSIEDIATDHFGLKVSSFGLRLLLGKFIGSGRNSRGVLTRLLQTALAEQELDLAAMMQDRELPAFQEVRSEVDERTKALCRTLHETLNPDGHRQRVVWLKESMLESDLLDGAKAEARELMAALHRLMIPVNKIAETIKEVSEKFEEKIAGMRIELDARRSRLLNIMGALKNFAVRTDPNQVPWLELRINRYQQEMFEYRVSPLNVAPLLRESLFLPFKSVLLTSATLDLGDGFKFLAGRNGLADMEERPWGFVSFPTPFDYSRQGRLLLLNMPSNPDQRRFPEELTDLVMELVRSGYPGGTLVLFTSYALLNMVARYLEGPLADAGVAMLVQGRQPRSYLVEHMKKTHGVLLGTDSFWEGIDLPGDALTKVIVTKLPFRQMGDPIFEARCNDMDRRGESSFRHYSLPLALLKFKQGTGRLIRHQEDRGILIVADNRIRTKSYGRKFLKLVDTYPHWDLPRRDLLNLLRDREFLTNLLLEQERG